MLDGWNLLYVLHQLDESFFLISRAHQLLYLPLYQYYHNTSLPDICIFMYTPQATLVGSPAKLFANQQWQQLNAFVRVDVGKRTEVQREHDNGVERASRDLNVDCWSTSLTAHLHRKAQIENI